LCIPYLKLEFITGIHFLVVFLQDLFSLFHVASAFSIAAPSASRPSEEKILSDMWSDDIHDHSNCKSCAHVAVPGNCEVYILSIQQGKVCWYIELWDLSVDYENQEGGVNELEEKNLWNTL